MKYRIEMTQCVKSRKIYRVVFVKTKKKKNTQNRKEKLQTNRAGL